MEIHLLTLFPGFFGSPFEESLMGKAAREGRIDLRVHDLREWTHDRHRTADDYAFGGGPGMVLKPEPFFEALESLRERDRLSDSAPVILTTPQGMRFDQAAARALAEEEQLVILCGRYRGVDERVREVLVTHEYSVGDVILNGGEAAALVMVEAITRLLPGAMSDPASAVADSFERGLLDHPHYTRPAEYRGLRVPEVLLSGNHAAIEAWRREAALKRTWERRPDLLEGAPLTDEERRYIDRLRSGEGEGAVGAPQPRGRGEPTGGRK